MNCAKVHRKLPGYLDDGLASRESARIREHLTECSECSALQERYARLSALMAASSRVSPPVDLAKRIRLEVAKLHEHPPLSRRLATQARLFCHNILQPMAVPATGGLLAAVLTFALVTQGLIMGAHFGNVPGDRPLLFIQPARVESLAPFSVSDFGPEDGANQAHAILVEATVDSNGDVQTYQILSGPNSASIRRQLDQVLLFSRFTPQLNFGRPISGGHVILSFGEVHVKG